MSLFDMLASGVKITNLDGTEADVSAIADEVEVPAETEETTETPQEETTVETVETTEDAAGDEVVISDTDELNTELLEVQEEEAEVEEAEEAIEEAEEAAVSTESLLKNLYAAKALGGLGIAHAELANEHVRYVGTSLGMSSRDLPAMDFSTESFSSAGAVALTTESAIQSVKDFLVKILDAILKGIAWLVDKGKALWSRIFQNYEKLARHIESVRAAAEKTKGRNAKESTIKSAGHAISLTMDGKIQSAQACMAAITGAVKEISAKWNAREVIKVAKETTAEVEKQVSKEEKQAVHAIGSVVISNDILTNLPFTNNEISASEAQKYGLSVPDGHVVYASDILPRNKRVVVMLKNDENSKEIRTRAGVFSSKVVSAKKDINLPVLSLSDVIAVLDAALKATRDMDVVKKKLNESAEAAKLLSGAISKLRNKYIAITKKQREGRGFIENNQFVRNGVASIKAILVLLREPAASFSSYFLFEVKGLVDYCASCVKQYDNVLAA